MIFRQNHVIKFNIILFIKNKKICVFLLPPVNIYIMDWIKIFLVILKGIHTNI